MAGADAGARADHAPGGTATCAPTPASAPVSGTPARVLVLTPIYPWPGSPPEGIFVHRQVRNLARLGHEVRVLAYHPAVRGLSPAAARLSWLRYHPRWLWWPGEQDGVPVTHLFHPSPRRRGDDAVPAIAEALSRFLDRSPGYRRTDVVYAHWLWTGGAAALALRERFGWPVAAIARGSEMHYWQGIHPPCRPYVDRVLEGADLVLANCDGLRRRADELVPGAASRVRVAYNGCDARRFRPAASRVAVRRALGLRDDARYFLCCASIIDRKGMAELAAAWSAFAARHPDWELVVVGRRVQASIVARLREAGGDRIRLVGEVPAARVAEYMQAADAYVQPSRLEGLANATMEAMATGLPVVATDTGGQGEAIRPGESGWLVPPEDPSALARAMSELASDLEHAAALGRAARATIVDRFDPVHHAGRLGAMLDGLRDGARVG